MEDHSPHVIDKSKFPRGEWDNEPDKLNWIDDSTNLDCMIVRNQMGALCGYVAVDEHHPLFGKQYGASYNEEGEATWEGPDVSVHGGLTYSEFCAGHICHIPEEGRPDRVWWFGFDCGHYMDAIPGMLIYSDGTIRNEADQYRNIEYVKEEIKNLASQLKALA